MTDAARYSFLPWVRQGVAGAIATADTLDASLPATATLPVELRVNTDSVVARSLRLHGPGDVIGLDARTVVKTDPVAGTSDFEPNFLAAVTFDRPDLPWMFTPAAAADGRLRPWMVLVVVTRGTASPIASDATRPLPVLTVDDPAGQLPPLGESWAWAHAQISGGLGEGETIASVLAAAPERVTARLLCPRRLDEKTAYVACVVPAFEVGRLAGLGLDVAADATLDPAWDADTAEPLELPVYYAWEFSTGAGGDFEALVRLLEPRVIPPEVGTRDVFVGGAGYGVPDVAEDAPGGILGLEGALRAPDSESTEWPEPPRDSVQAALRAAVDAPATLLATDPLGPLGVAPPIYGRWHAAVSTVPDDDASWVADLNLDPRPRAAAGIGTVVIQKLQEQLMASAWRQVGPIEEANRRLRQAQLARFGGGAIHAGTLAALSKEPLLQITAPALGRVRMSPITPRAMLAASRIPVALLSAAFRRIARPTGPLMRRLRSPSAKRTLFDRLNRGDVVVASPTPPLNGVATFDDLAGTTARSAIGRVGCLGAAVVAALFLVVAWFAFQAGAILLAMLAFAAAITAAVVGARLSSGASAGSGSTRPPGSTPNGDVGDVGATDGAAVAGVPPRPDFSVLPPGAPPVTGSSAAASVPAGAEDSVAAGAFRAAAIAHQDWLARAGTLSAVPATPPPLDLAGFATTLLARLDPATTVPRRALSRVRVPAAVWSFAEDPIEPIMAAPTFPQPMYEPLRDHSRDLVLPGADLVLPNTITLLETNDAFIEAYMVGLSHEMGRELLWREFPTDQRGTYFCQFWDVRGHVPAPVTDAERTALEDLTQIHTWRGTSRLGDHVRRPPGGQLVLLLRGELLRRYPTAVISAVHAMWDGDRRVPDNTETADARYPVFKGTVPSDLTFLGFDLSEEDARGTTDTDGDPGWFFVIEEQPTEPRFGFDVAVAYGDQPTEWDDLSWGTLASDADALAAMSHVTLDGDRPDLSRLEASTVEWGANAAHMAWITYQRPVRIAIHADDMLPSAPVVESVTPDSGPATGGTTVIIQGRDLLGVRGVSFGGVDATSFTVQSDTRISAVTPEHVVGPVDVVLVTSRVMRNREAATTDADATGYYSFTGE